MMHFVILPFLLFSTRIYTSYAFHTFQCSNNPNCTCVRYNSTDILAKCSRLNLHHFPVFRNFVTHIDLSHNVIRGIGALQKKAVPPIVRYLDISYNDLQYIAKGFVGSMTALQYLDVSYNRELNFDVLLNISDELPVTSIRTLHLSGIHCLYGHGTRFLKRYTSSWNFTSLTEISLADNRIENVDSGVIRSFPKTVKILNLSNNRLIFNTFVYEMTFMSNIQLINISNQNKVPSLYDPISSLLQNCTDKKNSLQCQPSQIIQCTDFQYSIPRLEVSNINISIYFPDTLQVVDISNSLINFVHFQVPVHIVLIIRNMREIYMQGNIIRRLDISGIIPVSTQHVDLSENFCSYIEKSYFPPGSKLRTLNLQGNLLGDFLDSEASSDIFQNILSLQTLLLSGNRIRGMNMDILTPLSDLRHLDLSVNEIDQLLISLRYFSNLTMLNLSRNRLMYLNKENIKDLEHIYTSRHPVRKLNINLRYNQLQCSCETLFFLKWMLRYQDGASIEFHNLTQYTCSSPNLTTLHFENLDKIVDHFEQICSSEEPIIVLGTIFIITFFFIIIFGIGHRYRWKIRFFYYSTKRVFRTLDTVSERHFEYDVFLSYADEDRHFVHNIILHELENDERGFKVCCHFRDFTAGRPIADNIAEAIHISRYTLCVISAHYLNSYWCMYEHNLAMMEMELARGGKDTVILLLTSTFRADEAPLSFLRFIQKNSYLEVPPENEDESKLLFVERLKNTFVCNP